MLFQVDHLADADRDQGEGVFGEIELDADGARVLPHPGAGDGTALGMTELDGLAPRDFLVEDNLAAPGQIAGTGAGRRGPAGTGRQHVETQDPKGNSLSLLLL